MIQALKLPKGYRFRVRQARYGEVAVVLEKRCCLFFWVEVDFYFTAPHPEHVLGKMHLLKDEMVPAISPEQNSLLGIYPPKVFLGEGKGTAASEGGEEP